MFSVSSTSAISLLGHYFLKYLLPPFPAWIFPSILRLKLQTSCLCFLGIWEFAIPNAPERSHVRNKAHESLESFYTAFMQFKKKTPSQNAVPVSNTASLLDVQYQKGIKQAVQNKMFTLQLSPTLLTQGCAIRTLFSGIFFVNLQCLLLRS